MISDFNKINFGGGIFYEIYSRNKPNRLSFYNELLYKRINQDGTTYLNYPAEIYFSRIKMINSLRFSYPKKSGRLYWGIGISTGARFNTQVNEDVSGFPDYTKSEFELGFMLSGGKTFSFSESFKLSAELRYEVEQGPFSTSSPFLGNHNIGLAIGLKLK